MTPTWIITDRDYSTKTFHRFVPVGWDIGNCGIDPRDDLNMTHPQNARLMNTKPLVVCLDQCAISELALHYKRQPEFAELRTLLLEGVEAGKVICPIAAETFIETSALSVTERAAIWELHLPLAAQHLVFKNLWQMIREETLALARDSEPPSPFQVIRLRNLLDDAVATNVTTDLQSGKEQMLKRVEQVPLVQIEGKPSLDSIRESVLLQHVSHVYRQTQRLLSGRGLDPADYMGLDLARYLVNAGITRKELEKLSEDLLHGRWQRIRVVFCRATLGSQLEVDWRRKGSPKKYDVNDEIDVSRLVVGLNAADLIITDGPMVSLCQSAKINKLSDAVITSVTKPEQALEFLRATLDRENIR